VPRVAPTVVAVLAMSLVAARAHADPPRRTVTLAIDVSALDPDTFARLGIADVYKGLLVRAVDEDLAVVALDQHADIRLTVDSSASSLRLRAVTASASREELVELDGVAPDVAHMHTQQVAAALLRWARDRVPAPLSADTPPAVVTIIRAAPRGRVDLYLGGGTIADRHGGLISIRLGGRAMLGARVALGLDLARSTPTGLPAPLHVSEWQAAASVRYRLGARPRALTWDVGIGLGVGLHRYDFAGTRGDAGDVFEPIALLTTRAHWHATRTVGLTLELGLQLQPRARRHEVDGQTVYESSPMRGLAALVVAVSL